MAVYPHTHTCACLFRGIATVPLRGEPSARLATAAQVESLMQRMPPSLYQALLPFQRVGGWVGGRDEWVRRWKKGGGSRAICHDKNLHLFPLFCSAVC